MQTQSVEVCGVATTIKIIGAKWTLLILRDLMSGKKRFGELQRSLMGISPKTLTVRLHQLEADGLVHREVFAEIPPHVEYALTDRGHSLQQIIHAMRDWGEGAEPVM
jgi:DNA-binding HxlR family transcriptional regulator